MATVKLTQDQGYVLREELLNFLSGINDFWGAIEREDFSVADRLGREFSDALRVFCDLDIGHQAGGSGVRSRLVRFRRRQGRFGRKDETVELTTPADVLRRALRGVMERAEDSDRDEAQERAEARIDQAQNRLVRETCGGLLLELERC